MSFIAELAHCQIHFIQTWHKQNKTHRNHLSNVTAIANSGLVFQVRCEYILALDAACPHFDRPPSHSSPVLRLFCPHLPCLHHPCSQGPGRSRGKIPEHCFHCHQSGLRLLSPVMLLMVWTPTIPQCTELSSQLIEPLANWANGN